MTSESTDEEVPDGDPADTPRRRDAAATRLLLLAAAQDRFARNGFQATKLRDISDDAGVNVALIGRYFGSKEGLFRACLVASVDDLDEVIPAPTSLGDKVAIFTRHLAGPNVATHANRLALLLRSSQDPQAEGIRAEILHSFSLRLSELAHDRPSTDDEQLLLAAQITLSAGLGIALIRASTSLEPLASATPEQLLEPLNRLITSLLGPN